MTKVPSQAISRPCERSRHCSARIAACAGIVLLHLGHAVVWGVPAAAEALPPAANQLLQRARDANPRRYQSAIDKGAIIRATPDGLSFCVLWLPPQAAQNRSILVALHGSSSWAFDEFALWQPDLERHNIGILALQWWYGRNAEDYLTPQQLYTLIAPILEEQQIQPGRAFVEGFSRGSANLYGLAFYDRQSHRNLFGFHFALSGGAQLDYPLYAEIDSGRYGDAFSGTRWGTFCGGLDPNPDREGCPGMRRTADWLKKFGGAVDLVFEEPSLGHGGFNWNTSRVEVLLKFLDALPSGGNPTGQAAGNVAQWLVDSPPPAAAESHFSVIGGASTMQLGERALSYIRSNGPTAFYGNATELQAGIQSLRRWLGNYVPALKAGGIYRYRDVQNFPWGMIEIQPGQYAFDVTDELVRGLQDAGSEYIGTVMPYAGWELQAAGYPPTTDPMCVRLMSEDVYYLAHGGRMDRVKDLSAYRRFLEKLVERYDGDGIDDMPGLTQGVRYWQIHNEPEGPSCGAYRDSVEGFVELMRVSYEAIHRTCSECRVLNGGAGIPLWRDNQVQGGQFWQRFAALGGAQYVDVIAGHFNEGKVDGGKVEDSEFQVRRLRELLGNDKDVWMTEFGVLVGSGSPGSRLATMPEADAAAWYVRFYTAGLAAGVDQFFSDAPSFVNPRDTARLLPFYVNKLLSTALGGFTRAERIADGQYRFTVSGEARYVLWKGMPAALSGTVRTIDLYGQEATVDAGSVVPSEASPVIVTSAQAADSTAPVVHLQYPNGGEIFAAGSNAQLLWTATDDHAVSTQRVELSTDGGQSWNYVLAKDLPGTQTSIRIQWPPKLIIPRALVRVVASDTSGNTGVDASDATFVITLVARRR